MGEPPDAITTVEMLGAIAYVLLLAASIPSLAASSATGINWALLPTWLLMTGYTASILKNLSPDKRSKRYANVVWLVWFTYYTLAIIWPFPLAWYDGLAMMALLLPPGGLEASALMGVYYVMSGVKYLGHGDSLQVSARSILVVVMGAAVARAVQVRGAGEHI